MTEKANYNPQKGKKEKTYATSKLSQNTWKNNCFTEKLIKEWSSEINKHDIISQLVFYLCWKLCHFSHFLKFPSPAENIFSSVPFSCSVVSNSLHPHGLQHARPPCPSPTSEAFSTHVHQVGEAIQPSHPLLSPLLLPSVFRSIRVFSNESVLHTRWPKYCSFSFSISHSNE